MKVFLSPLFIIEHLRMKHKISGFLRKQNVRVFDLKIATNMRL